MEIKLKFSLKKIKAFSASLLAGVLLLFFSYSLYKVILFKNVNPFYKSKEDALESTKQRWASLDEIPIEMVDLILLREDSHFFFHNGVVLSRMLDGFICYLLNGFKPTYGFSTISQQTSKIIFLYHDRTIVRKILEAYYTALIELIWGKARILEVYMNSVEVGKDIYGLETGAHHFFSKTLKDLTLYEKTLLACCLTNPHKKKIEAPSEEFQNQCRDFAYFYTRLKENKEKRANPRKRCN